MARRRRTRPSSLGVQALRRRGCRSRRQRLRRAPGADALFADRPRAVAAAVLRRSCPRAWERRRSVGVGIEVISDSWCGGRASPGRPGSGPRHRCVDEDLQRPERRGSAARFRCGRSHRGRRGDVVLHVGVVMLPPMMARSVSIRRRRVHTLIGCLAGIVSTSKMFASRPSARSTIAGHREVFLSRADEDAVTHFRQTSNVPR